MSEGNPTLEEAFRHHAWATRRLLAFCAQLRPEQLSQPRPAPLSGVHGSILEALAGRWPVSAPRWPPSVQTMALHHGSAHREQICAILRDFGLDPPELQPWDFADATGRSRWVKRE